MFSGGSFFFLIVSLLLFRVQLERVSVFWFRNQNNRTVMGFGVGAGKCHRVTRKELIYLNLLLDGKKKCKWYLPLIKNEAGVK